MSPKYPLLTAGLTALGLFGIAGLRAAGPDEPAPRSLPMPVAETAAAPAPAAKSTVLLLSNGQMLQGDIIQEGEEYVLRQKAGAIRFPSIRVEGTFESITAVYRYKREQVPDNDPDEHLKLARWCLTQNLRNEAKAELAQVARLSPSSREAAAMLGLIAAQEARGVAPRVDAEVVQTGASQDPSAPTADRPEELDAAVLRRGLREMRVSGAPVIFDLPPAAAVNRAELFRRNVHPVLQSSCAKCHNESHQGSFQLVEVKSRKGLTEEVYRANLDATLQLVDPDNPSRGKLLSACLLPHEGVPGARPIFRGSNDPRFQIIAAWVNSLRPGRGPDNVQRTRGDSSGFASDRPGAVNGTYSEVHPGVGAPVGSPRLDLGQPDVLAPTRYVPGRGMVAEKEPPGALEFPVPFAAGGPPPGRPGAAYVPNVPPRPKGDLSVGVPPPPGMLPEIPGAPKVDKPTPPAAAPPPFPDLPADAKPLVPTGKPKKEIKIREDLLQKALMNRNTPSP